MGREPQTSTSMTSKLLDSFLLVLWEVFLSVIGTQSVTPEDLGAASRQSDVLTI